MKMPDSVVCDTCGSPLEQSGDDIRRTRRGHHFCSGGCLRAFAEHRVQRARVMESRLRRARALGCFAFGALYAQFAPPGCNCEEF